MSGSCEIHPTAIVSPKAELAGGVKVGPYSIIDAGVKVGEGTVIGEHVVLTGNTTIGKNNRIYTGAVIGSIPQDLKFKGEKTYLEIGDGNSIREYCTLNLACGDGQKTIVGSNNLLMAYVHIAHNCIVGSNCILANAVTLAGHVEVHDYAGLGGSVGVHQFTKIGSYAFIGGWSKVVMDIAPYSMVDGNPARTHGINTVGLERRGFSPERIRLIKKAHKIIFREKHKISEAIELLLELEPESEDIQLLVDFLRKSERGLTR